MKKYILVILLIFSFIIVKADTNDSNLEKIRYDNYYAVHMGQNGIRTYYAQRYAMNGITSYCINIGVGIDTNIYSSTNDLSITGLSSDIVNYIRLVAYYGYDYTNHNTMSFFMAAQELIWERITDEEVYWKYGETRFNVDNEKSIIEELIRKHYILPTVEGYEMNISINNSVVVRDENYVLQNFEVYSGNARIDGNNIFVYAMDKRGTDEIRLIRKNYANNINFIYYSGNNQKMISTGVLDPVISSFKVNSMSSILKLRVKTNEIFLGEAIIGKSKYQLFDSNNNLVDTIFANSSSRELAAGKYYLLQENPSDGFEKDNTVYELYLSNDNEYLTVYENVIKKEINLYNVYDKNTSGVLEKENNIDFSIYLKKTGEKVLDINSNQESSKFSLPYGEYTIKQNSIKEGYNKIEDLDIIVNDSESMDIILSNTKISSLIKVIVIDNNGKKILKEGITFKIKNKENNQYICQHFNYPNNQEICEFKTNNSGEFITPSSLEYGNYLLEEIPQKIDGFLFNNVPLEFSIDSINTKEIDFIKKKVLGNLKINIYGENNINTNIILDLYKNDSFLSEISGLEINNLDIGEYYIKVHDINNLYRDNNNIYNFKINYIDEYTDIINEEIEIYNYLKKGSLTYINNNLNQINIYDENNSLVFSSEYSEGIKVDNLPIGKYYINNELMFEIKKDNENVLINIENQELKIEVPNTKKNSTFIIPLLNILFLFWRVFYVKKNN